VQGDSHAAKSFTTLLAAALVLGLAAAVVIAPIAAMLLAAAGVRFPFPRIFDRTVMVTLGAGLLWLARPLGLAELLRRGLSEPTRNLRDALAGMLLALATIAVLFAAVVALSPGNAVGVGGLVLRAMRYVAAAIVIGILEEVFFRAILLGGMARELGRRMALVASAAIFAFTHLARSPAHFYVTGFAPTAGLHDLAGSLERVAHPGAALPMALGLFLLALALGEAFLITGRVYASIGMHTGFVLGAKTWPVIAHPPRAIPGAIPGWIAGPGPIPLIAAPAAWVLALVMMAVLPLVVKRRGDLTDRGPVTQIQVS
jgi:CAAX protease family protein